MHTDMNAVAAYLDRGWDLLHRGDVTGARVSAGKILEVAPDQAAGHALMGAILSAEGEPDEAMDALRQAMWLDPDAVEVRLQAAELALHGLRDPDEGLAICNEARDLVSDRADVIDLGLLSAEAHLLRDERDRAVACLQRLPPPPYEEPRHLLRCGRLLLEVEQAELAVELLEQAAGADATRADARYLLGVAWERLGQVAEALEHFMATHAMDRETDLPSPDVSAAQIEDTVRRTVETLAPDQRRRVEGALAYAKDLPPRELVAEGFDPRGVVFVSTQPGREGEPVVTGVFVYQRNIARLAGQWAALPALLGEALEQALGQRIE